LRVEALEEVLAAKRHAFEDGYLAPLPSDLPLESHQRKHEAATALKPQPRVDDENAPPPGSSSIY
jgi:hypothetical protein